MYLVVSDLAYEHTIDRKWNSRFILCRPDSHSFAHSLALSLVSCAPFNDRSNGILIHIAHCWMAARGCLSMRKNYKFIRVQSKNAEAEEDVWLRNDSTWQTEIRRISKELAHFDRSRITLNWEFVWIPCMLWVSYGVIKWRRMMYSWTIYEKVAQNSRRIELKRRNFITK